MYLFVVLIIGIILILFVQIIKNVLFKTQNSQIHFTNQTSRVDEPNPLITLPAHQPVGCQPWAFIDDYGLESIEIRNLTNYDLYMFAAGNYTNTYDYPTCQKNSPWHYVFLPKGGQTIKFCIPGKRIGFLWLFIELENRWYEYPTNFYNTPDKSMYVENTSRICTQKFEGGKAQWDLVSFCTIWDGYYQSDCGSWSNNRVYTFTPDGQCKSGLCST